MTSNSSQRYQLHFLFTFIKTSTGHPIHPSVVDTRRIGKLTVLPETPQLMLNECEAIDGVLYDSLGTKKLFHWAQENHPPSTSNSFVLTNCIDSFIIVN